MKLSVQIKALIIFTIFSLFSHSLTGKVEMTREFDLNKSKSKLVDLKQDFARNFRFKNSLLQEQLNVFIANTEVSVSKPAGKKNGDEQEIYPIKANSGTFYSWGFSWWTFLSFPPNNTIQGRSHSYWLSKKDVNEDYLEYHFEIPTKIDSMTIDWRLPPTSFLVEFLVKENGAWIPLIERYYKYKAIDKNGHRMDLSSVSNSNALMFRKPVFAKAIKITMYNPLKSHKFGVYKIRFYNHKTTMVILNQSVDPCKQICFYVNTNKAKEGTTVEGTDCLAGLATADNRELFQYWNDRTIRTYNSSKLCIGFDMLSHNVILKSCNSSSPFTFLNNPDSTLSFKGFENMCLSLDTSKSLSDNFINENTEIKASSEFDKEVYKKENIRSKF